MPISQVGYCGPGCIQRTSVVGNKWLWPENLSVEGESECLKYFWVSCAWVWVCSSWVCSGWVWQCDNAVSGEGPCSRHHHIIIGYVLVFIGQVPCASSLGLPDPSSSQPPWLSHPPASNVKDFESHIGWQSGWKYSLKAARLSHTRMGFKFYTI